MDVRSGYGRWRDALEECGNGGLNTESGTTRERRSVTCCVVMFANDITRMHTVPFQEPIVR